MKKKTRKLSAIQKALRALKRPLNDRQREFYPFLEGAMLLDDSGGECVTSFDDATACHYFLIWLREQRVTKQAQNKAMVMAKERRARFAVLVGGAK